MKLLTAAELEDSSVAANCRMNRERNLLCYRQELGCDPLVLLRAQAAERIEASWLDVCCGSGRALIQAAARLTPGRIKIEGVDLIDRFEPNPFPDVLKLRDANIERWITPTRYALITCVHGIHYLGDKLAVIAKLVGWLAADGALIATLDLSGFRFEDGSSAGRAIAKWLRNNGLQYSSRRRTLRCLGPRELVPPFAYLGADDRVGPNYTGQPAVAAVYAKPARPLRRAVNDGEVM